MSLTAGIVILAVMAFRILFRRAPKIFSYALWIATLFRLLCPVSFSFTFSLLEVLNVSLEESGQIVYIPENIGLMAQPEINLPVPAIRDVVNAPLPPATVEDSVNPMQLWLAAGACLWVTGVFLMASYSAAVYWKLNRKLKTAVRESENIYYISGIQTSFVCGIFFPRIYLLSFFEEKEKEYILLHERIHLKRKDPIWRMAGYIALCVHWFNPLVWVAFFQSERDMEMSCDEAVIGILGNERKKEYSASLLSFASGRRIILAAPPAFGEGETGGRIKNILRYKKPTRTTVVSTAIVCAFALAVLLANLKPGGKQADMDLPEGIFGNAVSKVYSVLVSKADILDGGANLLITTVPGTGNMEVLETEAEQVSFLTTEQLMQNNVEDGKYRAYVCSVSRSAKGIDQYFAGLEDNG